MTSTCLVATSPRHYYPRLNYFRFGKVLVLDMDAPNFFFSSSSHKSKSLPIYTYKMIYNNPTPKIWPLQALASLRVRQTG